MSSDFSHLPYRPCVGIMLLNADNLVWIGQRLKKWTGDQSSQRWQMPQGGIDEGEEPETAALRELEEETGTRDAHILAQSSRWLTYDLPEQALGTALKGKYRGQRQKWFVMRFDGSDGDFDISEHEGHKAEFSAWRWAPMGEAVELIVPFKRPIYRGLAKEFASLLA